MNLLKAINRLTYTVSNGNKCNDTDITALNSVIDWINRQKEERIFHNHHFAKLAMFIYNEFLVNYKGDNKICERELCRILEIPLQHHYEKFQMLMNMYSDIYFFETIGTKPTWQLGQTLEETLENVKYNRKLFSESDELFKEHLSINNYQMEDIHPMLNHVLTELLNKYENKDHDLHWMLKYKKQ